MSSHTWRDGGFNDGDLQVRSSISKHVGGAETAGSGTDDDDVALGVFVEILEVATGHGTRDLALTDRGEIEFVPFSSELVQNPGLAGGSVQRGVIAAVADISLQGVDGWSLGFDEGSCWWRHLDRWSSRLRVNESWGRFMGWGKREHDPFAGIIQIKL